MKETRERERDEFVIYIQLAKQLQSETAEVLLWNQVMVSMNMFGIAVC